MPSDFIYEQTARLFRFAAGVPVLSGTLETSSRVFLRYQRTLQFLRHFGFDSVIDGGANIGEFASLVRMALPNAQLLCVEPHPGCAQKLRSQKFEVFEAALWKTSGEKMSLVQMNESTTSCQLSPDAKSKGWEVNTLRLDALPVRGNNLLVKLDLQGAEMQALASMGELWPRCRALVLETSLEPGGNGRELRALCESQGFTEYAVLNELYRGDELIEMDKVWIRPATSA